MYSVVYCRYIQRFTADVFSGLLQVHGTCVFNGLLQVYGKCSGSVGRALDWGSEGCLFKTHRGHCVVSLSKPL